MSRRVVFSPEAEEQLADLYHYIAAAASPETAARYTEAIISSYCEDLRMFPRRDTMHGDIRPELREHPARRHRRVMGILWEIMSIGAGSLCGRKRR